MYQHIPSPYEEELAYKAKLRSSILWLMSKAYNYDVPLNLLEPFDELSALDYQFKDTILEKLTNAEYYALCLANLYFDQRYSTYTHSNIVDFLTEKQIFREDIDLRNFTEYNLSLMSPFSTQSHLAIIEGLMNLYIIETLDPNQVALACDGFIAVHNDELPEDAEDAALFWINKSYLRKKQEVILFYRSNENDFSQNSNYNDEHIKSSINYYDNYDLLPTIHMQSLSDLRDGCALATLISLYCSNDFVWEDIRYEPSDPTYNIKRIQHFCRSLLPYNICFLATDDIFSLTHQLKTNILAFIADLWQLFVVKPCDLVTVPCRIVQNEVLEDFMEDLCISSNNIFAKSPNRKNFSESKQIYEDKYNDREQLKKNGTSTSIESNQNNGYNDLKKAQAFEIDLSEENTNQYISKVNKMKTRIKSRSRESNKEASNRTGTSPLNMTYDEEKSDAPQKMNSSNTLVESRKNAELLVIGDEGSNDDTSKNVTKKQAFMLLSSRRKAELEAKKVSKTIENSRLKEEEFKKREEQEQRRIENKKKREKILEQYRLKKKAAEAEKGQQQEKQQIIPVSMTNVNNIVNKPNQPPTARSEYSGPKLYAKPAVKSNLNIIQQAILKALEGPPNAKILARVQEKVKSNSQTCKHFLILFRDRLQFRGLYEYNDRLDIITKLDGIGPKLVNNEDIIKYYKYDLPRRQFEELQTKSISLTIAAFSIHDSLWYKNSSMKHPVQNDITQKNE